ncbi:unnamed protein product [Darwinula stevensoni]|uniref:G-protein coupled receptors family 2 profile 2 domain-containing protein n=1 Tax=Darwinula stevensoni TaxID=69355 RepID=A0A7R8X407_9CRUS|nr:unnamed protein product [Darwinula stevensoni]CAG0879166.1 unnamed protein product [Darwinula stevensoni]
MMMTFKHCVICVSFHFLVTLPGNWVRSELQKCCPGQDQYGVHDRETGVTKCHVHDTNQTIGLPECKEKVKLVLDQPDPILLATTPRCRDEFLEEDGTFINAFLFCLSGFGTDPAPDPKQDGTNIVLRKCCPLEEGYDPLQKKCVPRPFSWSLPVLNPETGEIRNLSSDEYQLTIDDLSSIPCKKYLLSPQKDIREAYHVFHDTGHLYLPALNFTYSPEEFCLDHGRIQNGSWVDLARICDPKYKKILKNCKGKVCVQKCCVKTDILHLSDEGQPSCYPADSLWDSKKHFHPHPPAEVHVITNFPICPGITDVGILLRPSNVSKDKFYVTNTGGLMVKKYKMVVNVPSYCIDDMKTNETVEPIAIFCIPEGSNVIQMIYSVLLVVSATFLFITFLLYLILPERKSLHGKTLLCYMGCLLVASIAQSVARIGSDKDISYSVCLTAALMTFYFYLSTFFWLNIISFDIWWNLRDLKDHTSSREHQRKMLIRYSLYGFGVPLCIVSIAWILDRAPNIPPYIIKPGFDPETRCWLNDDAGIVLYFYAPVSILLVANAIFFALTSRFLIQHSRDTAHLNRSQSQTQKQKFMVYMKLFILMGVSWLTEVITYFIGEPIEAFVFTDAINILQGVFIFFIFICKTKTIKYLKKNVCKCFFRHGKMNVSLRRKSKSRGRGSIQHLAPTSPIDSKNPDHGMSYYNSKFDSNENSESSSSAPDKSVSNRTKSTNVSETST